MCLEPRVREKVLFLRQCPLWGLIGIKYIRNLPLSGRSRNCKPESGFPGLENFENFWGKKIKILKKHLDLIYSEVATYSDHPGSWKA